MQRKILEFGLDDAGDRFAVLDCGHRQHVRHRPPFVNRPWTVTEEGRHRMLGETLNCVLCDEGESWFSLGLGDALTAEVRLAEIEDAFAQAFSAAGEPIRMAVLKRHDTAHSVQCEVTVYFSPAAADVAKKFGAASCVQPLRRNLDLLAGDARCWEQLFST